MDVVLYILAFFIYFLFTIEQLEQIQRNSFARMICSNSDLSIKEIQPKVFRIPDEYVVLAFSKIKHSFKLKNINKNIIKKSLLCYTRIFFLHFFM